MNLNLSTKRLLSYLLILPSLLIAHTASAQTIYPQLQVDQLLRLMQQRLLIAHEVARWKWNQQRPIEDQQREHELIVQVRQQAERYELPPDTVTAFFQGQIQAGKLIQTADFHHWQHLGIQFFPKVSDLNQTLRPSLDKLNTEFLANLAQLNPILGCPNIQEMIKSRSEVILLGDGVNRTVQNTAIAPLLEVKGCVIPKS
jgi:chorismate mutase